MLAELQSHREIFVAHFYDALDEAARGPERGERGELRHALVEAERHARALGQYAFDLFPRRRIVQLLKRMNRLSGARLAELALNIQRRQML